MRKIVFSHVALLFVISFFVFGCRSVKPPTEVFTPPDYTQEDVVRAEKKRIEEMREKDSVQALWRALILGDEETVTTCEQAVEREFLETIKNEQYLDASRLYNSLVASGFGERVGQLTNVAELRQKLYDGVPGLGVVPKEFQPKTIANCIDATVTVWVDRGIKVQYGAGYADRIIGSGFFIDERGYIVTNHHVISDLVDPKYEGYARLYIRLNKDSDTRIPAKVIGYDSALDLALLKTEITPPFVLSLGSSSDLEVGDRVSAIGTPLGLEGTLTQGIVSSVDRKLFMIGNVMQIDAAINSGNSGGPLIDSNMRVQAIAFAGIQDYQGLNFAIPVEYLRQDLPYLYRGGERVHPWSGSYGHTIKLANGRENGGLELQYSMPGGSSSRAEIPNGAVIIEVNGIAVDSLEAMQAVMRSLEPKTIVTFTYRYKNEIIQKPVYLASRPKNPGYDIYISDLVNTSFIPLFGMSLTPSSTTSRRQYMITNVLSGGIADESGFSVNDSVNVGSVKFSDDKSQMLAEISTRRSKKGYLDITMGLVAALNSPYYF